MEGLKDECVQKKLQYLLKWNIGIVLIDDLEIF